jgi:glycerol-3-phosphate dehydrogenase
MLDVAIIGAGAIGGAIARELSKYDLRIALLEKGNDVCTGTSKANSGIVHAGYDSAEGTLMAKLCAAGNALFDAMCGELSVPFARNGSLVAAFDGEQLTVLEALMRRGAINGVPGLSILSREELLRQEPSVSPEAVGALCAPTAGIVDPMLLTTSLIENAVANGVELFVNFEVSAIRREGIGYRINDTITARYIINAAGVASDAVHNLAAPPAFRVIPRRGQYFLLDKAEKGIVHATIFPCPSKAGKGILVAPTVHGNILLGPASDLAGDTATSDDTLHEARQGARLLVPKASTRNTIRTFAGVRAEADTGDFIIREAEGAPGFFDVAGIKSPGLTAAPAIAAYVVAMMGEKGLALKTKPDFNPVVRRPDSLYGRVICRCESITEGDIVDAIHRPAGATTLDGVKRRCRAGMGRCQGGFCGPKVQQIIARELGKPLEEIVLEGASSYILTGRTK